MKTIRAMYLLAASPLAVIAAAAHAQDAPPTVHDQPVADSAQDAAVPDVVVTGTRAALENAENVKRNSAVTIDGITSDDIGQLPDVSISESLIRISGVSSNDTVRGSDQVAIRGLGPDLVSTEYNGRVLPTADGATRRVGLAGLPTEGISAAYAQKTPDGSTIEGGVAGILELQTIHPLDTRRKGLTLVVRGLYDDTANQLKGANGISPFGVRGEVTYVGKLADNFGVTFSYAGIKQYSVETGYQLDGWQYGTTTRADPNHDGTPDALPLTAGPFMGYFTTVRHSAIAMAQWDPSSAVRVSVDGLYDNDHYQQGTRRYYAFQIFNGTLGAPTSSDVIGNAVRQFSGTVAGYRGVVGNSDVHDHTYEGGLNVAVDDGGPIKANFDFSYAEAGRDRNSPTVNFENDAANATLERQPFSYDTTDPSNPSFDFQPFTADDYNIQQANVVEQHSIDRIKAFRADFTYKAHSFIDSVQWGFRIDGRHHTQNVDTTLYNYANVPARPDLDSSYLQTSTNPFTGAAGAFGGASAVNFPYYDLQKILQLAETAPGVVVNDQFSSDVGSDADVHEMSYALYAQANLDAGPLTGNVGARWVLTDETVEGVAGTTPENVVPQRFAHSYNYFLPALNLRYEPTHKLIARFAAAKTMSRPLFSDLAVGTAVDLTTVPDSGVVTITRGNPNLQPFTSKGVDLGLEWYPSKGMSLSIEGYYKWVDNFTTTETTNTTVTLTDGTVVPAVITQTINDPRTRHFRGIEVQFRRDFDFLPGFLQYFGVQGNWNHNLTDEREQFTSLVGYTVDVLPINFSKDVVNAQLYYSKRGIDLRAAYRYYSGYSRAFSNGYQYMPAGEIDLSAGFSLRSNIRLTGTATNVFGAHVIRTTADYRDLTSQALLQHYTFQGRSVTLGIRVQL